jgi:hypothetical protein
MVLVKPDGRRRQESDSVSRRTNCDDKPVVFCEDRLNSSTEGHAPLLGGHRSEGERLSAGWRYGTNSHAVGTASTRLPLGHTVTVRR